jgi:hypothetical protein
MHYRVLGVAQYCNQIARFETESETKSKGNVLPVSIHPHPVCAQKRLPALPRTKNTCVPQLIRCPGGVVCNRPGGVVCSRRWRAAVCCRRWRWREEPGSWY